MSVAEADVAARVVAGITASPRGSEKGHEITQESLFSHPNNHFPVTLKSLKRNSTSFWLIPLLGSPPLGVVKLASTLAASPVPVRAVRHSRRCGVEVVAARAVAAG